ncbi:MAG: hypothetical protein ALAOOOJD_00167 [bacterium]|nr:hypothetical protein [bacterium]
MHHYKRLMVGLNLSAQDEATIRYAAVFSRMAQSAEIHFVHVVPRLKIPMSVRLRYPNLYRPVMNQMEHAIKEYWDGHQKVALAYDVAEGTPLTELIYRCSLYAIDLMLVGNRQEQRESGVLPEKLALDAPCSVLIVPEGTPPNLTQTLVVTARSQFPAHDPAEAIVAIAQEQGADLLVIDARELNDSAAVRLVTVMKQLIRNSKIPLLVWKNRNTGMPVLKTGREWKEDAWKVSSVKAMEISHRSLAA